MFFIKKSSISKKIKNENRHNNQQQQLRQFHGLGFAEDKTRTGSVQKVCGGVWQGFDHLTKLESSKVEVVLQ